jgi:hypothetical protein
MKGIIKSHVIAPANLPKAETLIYKQTIVIYIYKNHLEVVALYPAGYILSSGQKAGLIHHSTNAETNTV